MRSLSLPEFDDHKEFKDLVENNNRLNERDYLFGNLSKITAAYQSYHGMPKKLETIKPAGLEERLANAMKSLYSTLPGNYKFLKRMRQDARATTCPMCGSFSCFTLDHLLPRASYPEFSIFSKNLVPACDCNNLRSNNVRGVSPEQRLFHPYYDTVLDTRLISVGFDKPISEVPLLYIKTLLSVDDDNHSALSFHISEIISRTPILKHFHTMWADLLRKPNLVLPLLTGGRANRAQIKDAIHDQLNRFDDVHRSKNNWNSAFVAGLLDADVVHFLEQRSFEPKDLSLER
jgi:hypothetical protein